MPRKRKHIKNKTKKYFLGGLLQAAASITPIGMLAKKLRGKKEEDEKNKANEMRQSKGGDGSHSHQHGGGEMGKSLVDKINAQKEGSGEGASISKVDDKKMKKGGKVKLKKKPKPFKKSGMKAKYEEGGKVEKSDKIDASNISIHKGGGDKESKDDFLKIDKGSLNPNTASIDTVKEQDFLSNKDLSNQYKQNKQKAFDKKLADNKRAMGTVGPPKHIQDAQAAALMNPISALYSGPIQAYQQRQKNKQASMEKGGVVRKYAGGGKVETKASKERERKYIKNANKNYPKTLEYEMLSGAGVLYSKKNTNKMKGILKSQEEKLYRGANRKPPKRIIT